MIVAGKGKMQVRSKAQVVPTPGCSPGIVWR
jgi:hypothetical protein